MWSTSEWPPLCFPKMLCCGAFMCCQWQLSPPKEFSVTLLDCQGSDLTYSFSACIFWYCFWWVFFSLSCHYITFCDDTVFFISYAGLSTFHNSPLLLLCLHLLLIVVSAEYKIICWHKLTQMELCLSPTNARGPVTSLHPLNLGAPFPFPADLQSAERR